MDAADECLHQVRTQRMAAELHEEAMRRQLSDARRLRAFWGDLHAELAAGHLAGALLLLQRHAGTMAVGAEGMAVLETVRAAVEPQVRAQAADFPRRFPGALAGAGVVLDDVSRHPHYTIRDGFLHIDVDEHRWTVSVQARDGQEHLLGMDLEPLVALVRREVARLFDQEVDRDAFLRRLRTAYDAVAQEDGSAVGAALPLRRVIARLANDAPPVAADVCNVTLGRLICSGHTRIDGWRLRVQQTRHARQGMLLYGLEQGGYSGFISFEREDAAC